MMRVLQAKQEPPSRERIIEGLLEVGLVLRFLNSHVAIVQLTTGPSLLNWESSSHSRSTERSASDDSNADLNFR